MQRPGVAAVGPGSASLDHSDGGRLTTPQTGAPPLPSGLTLHGAPANVKRNWRMDTQATVQSEQEPRTLEEDWAEADWFLEWLRLARRDYQGAPPGWAQLRQAA